MHPKDETPIHTEDHSIDSDDQIIGVAFRGSLLVILFVTAIAGCVWWYLQPQPKELDTTETLVLLPRRREMPNVRIPHIPFLDITSEAGIDFIHENGANGEKLLPETMGGGCGFLDIDNDGDQDIVLINGSRWPWDITAGSKSSLLKIYLNDGTGRFETSNAESELDAPAYGTGLACADIDGDGLTDLFISCVGPDRLYRNLGNLQFEDITEKAGVSGPRDSWSTSCGFIDINNDDDLDLFVCSYVEWSRDADRSQDFRLVGGERAYGRPQNFAGTFARLYLNTGNGTFTDISQSAGIQIRNPATHDPLAKSLGVTFEDFDDDGWMDIIVANDTVQNFLFHNKHDCTFEEIGGLAGVAFD
ncbi:MAG: VCBS repeat-containing protein, partial [Pirellulales bacterium]